MTSKKTKTNGKKKVRNPANVPAVPAPAVPPAEPPAKPDAPPEAQGAHAEVCDCERPLVSCLVGPEPAYFTIHIRHDGVPEYAVNRREVTRDVYLDALATAARDRWYPGWEGEHIPSKDGPQVVFDARKVS